MDFLLKIRKKKKKIFPNEKKKQQQQKKRKGFIIQTGLARVDLTKLPLHVLILEEEARPALLVDENASLHTPHNQNPMSFLPNM